MPDELKSGFAVVIPMYDEEAGAENCVRKVYAVLSRLSFNNALIIVNDGSSDETGMILSKLEGEYPGLILVTHEKNMGYGAALKTGTRRAAQLGFEYVLFMDSDLTNDPADITKFTEKMKEGCDVIKASRYSHGGKVEGVPFYRVLISRVGNLIARILFHLPVFDCTNGFRAVKTNILMAMNLQGNNFSIIMEELYYAKYLAKSFCNIPIVLTNRSNDLRPTSFRYRPSIFYDYLKYPLKCLFYGNPLRRSNVLNSRREGKL